MLLVFISFHVTYLHKINAIYPILQCHIIVLIRIYTILITENASYLIKTIINISTTPNNRHRL